MTVDTFSTLSMEDQIKTLVDGRAPGEKQIELAIFLIDQGILSGAAEAAAYIEAVREYNRMKREAAGEPEKRVPKVKQIIDALQSHRDDAEAKQIDPDEGPLVTAYLKAMNDSISIAGRFV